MLMANSMLESVDIQILSWKQHTLDVTTAGAI